MSTLCGQCKDKTICSPICKGKKGGRMNFEEIGKKAGLDDKTLTRYTLYMIDRWAHEEGAQCKSGYAMQWALRFKNGIEYAASDAQGQWILRNVEGLKK